MLSLPPFQRPRCAAASWLIGLALLPFACQRAFLGLHPNLDLVLNMLGEFIYQLCIGHIAKKVAGQLKALWVEHFEPPSVASWPLRRHRTAHSRAHSMRYHTHCQYLELVLTLATKSSGFGWRAPRGPKFGDVGFSHRAAFSHALFRAGR
jgi:hypothetical protein